MKKKLIILLCILSQSYVFAQVIVSPKVQNKAVKKPQVVIVTPPTEAQTSITLENIDEWLCPKSLERGDREFDGHGPRVKSEVKIRLANNGTEIWADISFSAIETVHDWSTTSGKWSRKVYEAPYGKKITKILSDDASRTSFVSPPGGSQFLFPGSDVKGTLDKIFEGGMIAKAVFAAHGIPTPGMMESSMVTKLASSYMNGNTVMKVSPTEGTLVNYFHIVGDTGGPDISDDDNCNDDTRIVKIEFFPLTVIMANR